MHAIGFVVIQHSDRLDRPIRAYTSRMDRIPKAHTRGMSYNGAVNHETRCIDACHDRSQYPG